MNYSRTLSCNLQKKEKRKKNKNIHAYIQWIPERVKISGKKKNYNCLLGRVIASAARSSNIQCGAACARCHASRRETKIIQPNQFFRCLIKISCRSPPLNGGVCVARNFSTDQRTILSRVQNLPLKRNRLSARFSNHGRDSRNRTSSPLSQHPNITDVLLSVCFVIRANVSYRCLRTWIAT